MLPRTIVSSDRSNRSYTTQLERNTRGDVTSTSVGSLQWKNRFDEFGNVVESAKPNRPAASFDVDARGAVSKQTLPDGATIEQQFHLLGTQTGYVDPTKEATNVVTDAIGRPVRTNYPDGTYEETVWERSRVVRSRDRQGRTLSYKYNEKAQLAEILFNEVVVDRYSYDLAGRLVAWCTADAEIGWSDFDLENRPKTTTQTRFSNGSGLASTPAVLDSYTQQHRWNEHGERVAWSMPTYSGLALGAGWAKWLRESHNAAGNVERIEKLDSLEATESTTLLSASYFGAGRPESRTLFSRGGAQILRSYGYEGTTGRLNRAAVSVNGREVAGSEVAFDGLQRSFARLLGVSGGSRTTHWRYDARGRLIASLYGVRDDAADPHAKLPGTSTHALTPADFRTAEERVPRIGEATAAALRAKGVDVAAIDPPSTLIAERSGFGHKIDSVRVTK